MDCLVVDSKDVALTIVICTHNRAGLLERTLASLNAARRPDTSVEILVVANACNDGTAAMLEAYRREDAVPPAAQRRLSLRWVTEPQAGKSHALNHALGLINTELTAFVDDDHRVDESYLVSIVNAARSAPEFDLFCGKILPDWDGTEPAWVHDEGPYRIYPLPVPKYDQGDVEKQITRDEGPIPGGGNLVIRRGVFHRTGRFSTELGPHGHDLGGGEDSEYVLRALDLGARCRYDPSIVQHHYVDTERLRLGYLIRKGFQRTRSTSRIHGTGRVPFYMWRKLFEYSLQTVFSVSWAKTRFYCVRTAAALGELMGRRDSARRYTRAHNLRNAGLEFHALLLLLAISATISVTGGSFVSNALTPAWLVAAGGTGLLLWRSIIAFSQTGPRIRDEVVARYRTYSLFALLRLSVWAYLLMLLQSLIGIVAYHALALLADVTTSGSWDALAAASGVAAGSLFQLAHIARFNPGLIVASLNYRFSRLHRLWAWATETRLRVMMRWACTGLLTLAGLTLCKLMMNESWSDALSLGAMVSFCLLLVRTARWPEPPIPASVAPAARRNILMIGSDTLRSDRLGAFGYARALTPNLDRLAQRSAIFTNCHVPCARTAPSLLSLLTGLWPHTHGVRDNFVTDRQTRLSVATLPELLKREGYYTAAISDWCGADMSKFSMGFDFVEVPEDQWNLKYLLRQGPKDLRLFVSIFLHNRLGWALLPELYYLGGVPQSDQLQLRARGLLSSLAGRKQPFLLNVFFSTTHPPFASEYPWYERFSAPAYRGESKFAMAKLTDPLEIIRRQGAPKEEFDLDQIVDLYDACVAKFDDDAGKLLAHLDACGLSDDTIVVVYSDHGMEFFEHNTWGQGNSAVGDFSSRIPLIIHMPGSLAHRVDSSVRSVDLVPTLLDLVGVPPPAVDGCSLAGAIAASQSQMDLPAFNETGFWLTRMPGLPDNHLNYPELIDCLEVQDSDTSTIALREVALPSLIKAKDRMLRRGIWKLVYQPLVIDYQLLLFNVQDDPRCEHNLIGTHPTIAAELWRELASWIKPEERNYERC